MKFVCKTRISVDQARTPRGTDRVIQLQKNDSDLCSEKRTLHLIDLGSNGWKGFRDVRDYRWCCQRIEGKVDRDEHRGQLPLFAVGVNVGDAHLTDIEFGLAVLSPPLEQRVDREQVRQEENVGNAVEENQLVDAMKEVKMGTYVTLSSFGRSVSVIEGGKCGREEDDRADEQHIDGIASRLGSAEAFGEERR